MSSTLIRRRLNLASENANQRLISPELNSFRKNNKKWQRILSLNSSEKERKTLGPVSEKILDQVALDVKRAFSFKNQSFSGKNIKFVR